MKYKTLTSLMILSGAAFSLVACSSSDTPNDEKQQEKKIDNQKQEATVLTEDEYIEQIQDLYSDLVGTYNAGVDVAPEGKEIQQKDADAVVKETEKAYSILEQFKTLNAPDEYKEVQKKIVIAADNAKPSVDQFIKQWKTLSPADSVQMLDAFENIGKILDEAYEIINSKFDLSNADKIDDPSSSYSVDEIANGWDYMDDDGNYYTAQFSDSSGYADIYESNADGTSKGITGPWHLDGDSIVVDVAYETFNDGEKQVPESEKQLHFDIVSVTDNELVLKHEGKTIKLSH